MASVSATINTLPVLCTPADCNKPRKPPEDIPKDVHVSFQDEESDLCCGIVTLGRAEIDDGDDGYGSGDHDSFPPRYKDAMVKALNDTGGNWTSKGLAMYSVNDSQVTEHEALKEAGFLVMAVFRNPNSGNRVTLYGKLINQPRQKPVKAKKGTKKGVYGIA